MERLRTKAEAILFLRNEIEREFEVGDPSLDIIERIRDERDKSRAEYQELLNRIINLGYDYDLTEQVA